MGARTSGCQGSITEGLAGASKQPEVLHLPKSTEAYVMPLSGRYRSPLLVGQKQTGFMRFGGGGGRGSRLAWSSPGGKERQNDVGVSKGACVR